MNKAMVCLAALLLAALAGCIEDDEMGAGGTGGSGGSGGSGTPVGDASTAVICSNFGPISVQLYTDKTPAHAKNFLELAASGYYDGVTFHRIMTDFMMQGGDPTGTGGGGETWDGSQLPDETRSDLKHDRAGLLSMANRGGDPRTGSSQFFITFAPTSWLDGKHVIFGEVTAGMDVVSAIEEAAASSQGPPREDVVMQKVLVPAEPDACPEAAGVPEPVPAYACPTQGDRTMRSPIDGDIITPGLLCITNTSDRSLVWARNHGSGETDVTFTLTGAGGGALPDGWIVSFDDAKHTLAGHKEKGEAAHTMLRVQVPEGTTGTFDLELRTGHSTTPVKAIVDLRHEQISATGDSVALDYAGRCAKDGQEFDSGSFSTTLGSGQTIPGFDQGLIGHGENEDVTIYIPAPIAYGYDGPVCAGDEADLIFDVTITKL